MKMPLSHSILARRFVSAQANRSTAGAKTESAFTMVEIALSLGIIAFALIAIIGVLPSGMKVQRENREDTIVNQDAAFLLEAIRSGSRGLDDLTNYVEGIRLRRQDPGRAPVDTLYTNQRPSGGTFSLGNDPFNIVALLSTPKIEDYTNFPNRVTTVTAWMRSISGGALEKSKDPVMSDFAFRYRAELEITGYTNLPPPVITNQFSRLSDRQYATNLSQNLHELRVTMRWPVFPNGNLGRYSRTFRTLVSGDLVTLRTNLPAYSFVLEPSTFYSAH